MQFDVYLTTYGVSLEYYWYILMMIQTIYVFGVAQLLLVFYESNENQPIVSTLRFDFSAIPNFLSNKASDPSTNLRLHAHLLQLLHKSLLRTEARRRFDVWLPTQ